MDTSHDELPKVFVISWKKSYNLLASLHQTETQNSVSPNSIYVNFMFSLVIKILHMWAPRPSIRSSNGPSVCLWPRISGSNLSTRIHKIRHRSFKKLSSKREFRKNRLSDSCILFKGVNEFLLKNVLKYPKTNSNIRLWSMGFERNYEKTS